MKIYLISILLFTSNSFSCVLTKEYLELRGFMREEAYQAYYACIDSTRSYFYYYAVSKCKAEGNGENVGGGCFHLIEHQQTHTKTDIEHCDIFKPTIEQMKEDLHFVSERDSINKCKKQ